MNVFAKEKSAYAIVAAVLLISLQNARLNFFIRRLLLVNIATLRSCLLYGTRRCPSLSRQLV